ncbi:Organic cation transporter-like protein [Holothuria leucospilota]|uniref:Organic cation transporter-like protein n=1 Tax=Holothuria leucospilota TaxID=206669 RepID=A0A9Q1BMD0_HOLLE|nr:Organic cation transporter-like protein [Holothuria leucospilota]
MVGFSQVFTSVSVDHWCAVSEWSDEVDECQQKDQSLYLSCVHQFRDASIPLEEKGDNTYSKCSRYDTDYPQDWYEGYYAGNDTNSTGSCEDGWVYDRSQYKSSAAMEFDLVCDRAYFVDVELAIYYTGYLIGSFLLGTISDKFGRFKAYYISVTGVTVAGFLIALSPTYWFYCFLRFIQGCANMVYGLAFTIGIEIVGPTKRALAGTIICLFYSGGYMLLAVLAYFITEWRLLQITITSCFILCYLYVTILPESIRWLLSQKKYDEAERLIRKTARINNKSDKLPSDFMAKLKLEEEELAEKQKVVESPYVQDLFRTRKLRTNTLNIAFQWVVNSMVYYGISLSTSSLGSNDNIAFFISGAVEIPAYLICVPVIESFLGRRGSTVIFEVIAGAACISTAFIPLGIWRVAVGMLGKFCISTSYAVIYIYAAELFPTPVRAVGIAVCTIASNFSAIFSALILILDQVWTPLPYLAYGSVAFIGGLLAMFLPETRGKSLPEVLETDDKKQRTIHR